MTERDRRLQRLLAVRTVQAALAAAHLRGLRQHEAALRDDHAHWLRQSQAPAAPASTHDAWLLHCAESQLAGVRAAQLSTALEEAAESIAEHAVTEQVQRIAQEQIDHLCTHNCAVAARLSTLAEQRSLDDLFNAAAVRRKAAAARRAAS